MNRATIRSIIFGVDKKSLPNSKSKAKSVQKRRAKSKVSASSRKFNTSGKR